jgi:hypothetical protein
VLPRGTSDLFAIDWFASVALAAGGLVRKRFGEMASPVFMADPALARQAIGRVRRRRTTTDQRLQEVAASFNRGRAHAVEHDHGVSRSQAFRLISQAREAGLLPAKGEA